MKIKKGDTILVISGKDRLKTGKVLNVFSEKETILVEGVNLRKKHIKPKKSGGKGQIVQIPAPLHISNIKLICKNCGKAVRVGYKKETLQQAHGKEKKYRFCKKCKKET